MVVVLHMEMEKGGVDDKLREEEVVDAVDNKLNKEEHWVTSNCRS